ncbi:EamA/RhaT family transporter [Aestuariivirga litoralis]|uniref:EamA/RhaT family transporter n=1 Tax=Aestuariivirga litoralis TaxID=2650924 RepID=A0A2W2AKB9_9HYPH|nr:DMT family transporter [Aestuariivirga litoralis]PZF75771.1 EamA/RhaT family transporter [Aestuariivirga litoralis]
MTSHNTLRAILAMVVSMGSFVASDSCMKLAMEHAPLFELMLMRGLVSLTVCLGLILALGQAGSIRRMFDKWLVARGVLETIANLSFIFALGFIAIADLTAIVQTCPLFVLLGAWAFRGEHLGGQRLFLILVGIAGAMLVAQPGSGAVSPLASLAFITAIASAIRDLLTPNVPKGMPPLVAALTVITVLTLTGLAGMLAVEAPVMPGPREILLMVVSGTMAVAGHLLLYLTYRLGEARTVAPFMYTLTIWAVLSGLVIFGEVPNRLAIAGMLLVALAGLAIIWLDGRQRKAEALMAVEAAH